MSTDTASRVGELLHEAAETHHVVYRIVDGDDPDWASWYAYLLLELSELPQLLSRPPVRSHLVHDLVEIDRAYTAEQPPERWRIGTPASCWHDTADGLDREDRAGVARRADARAVRSAPGEGDGASVHRRVRPRLRSRHVPLRGLRRRALRVRGEVRLRLRLACFLGACVGGRGGGGGRHELRHGPHRGPLRGLRRTSRTRLPRRAAPDRAALLHQLRRDEARRGVALARLHADRQPVRRRGERARPARVVRA